MQRTYYLELKLKISKHHNVEINKIVLYFFVTLFLTGCYQSTAMVGPTLTLVSTGNISQAGFTFITNKAVEKRTGMTTTEYVSTILKENNKKNKKNKKIHEDLIILVQTHFEKTRKKLFLQDKSKILN